LRDSWSGVTQAIEELEKEGRVLVTRTDGKGDAGGKGQMKCVFLDDIGREKEPLDKGELYHPTRWIVSREEAVVSKCKSEGLRSYRSSLLLDAFLPLLTSSLYA